MTNTLTYAQALEMAIKVCSVPANAEEYSTVVEKLTALKEKYSKTHTLSDEAKAKQSELRKAKTAAARSELITKVAPVLREGLSHTLMGLTAKELFAEVADKLPEDFTAPKVQNVLLREMRDELVITEAKGKANTYALKSVVG
jgi:hypothetical protein